MKKNILAAILIVTALTFNSCSSDDNSSKKEDTISKFQGTWTGTYSGPDSGTWTATIDMNGVFVGQTASSELPVSFQVKGEVDSTGKLEANFYLVNNVVGEFKGSLINNSGQGQWTNTAANISGTWQGTKN